MEYTKEQLEFLKTAKVWDKVEIRFSGVEIRIFLYEKEGEIFCVDGCSEKDYYENTSFLVFKWTPDEWQPILPKQYRPYTQDDWKLFNSKPIKEKKQEHNYNIISFGLSYVDMMFRDIINAITYQELLDYYEHIDGTPCGVEI